MLDVRLLGPFEVTIGGASTQAREWSSAQVRTILKVLLTRRGHVVPADQLLELLWPDADPDVSRQRLYVRISQLRRILDPDRPQVYVQSVPGGYTFAPQVPAAIDVDSFERAADRGQKLQEEGELALAAGEYERACQHYRGDYLEEDLYEEWTFAERERLRERYLTVLTELAECLAQRGLYRRARALCDQILAQDPCREAIYVRLMLYHYYAGEQTQALQAYARCQEALRASLDVAPLPETVRLADEIRGGTLWRDMDAPRYPPPTYRGRLFEVPYSLGHMPFVGREREYAWLVEQWKRLAPGLILIEGEAGAGKSRLVEEFLGYVDGQGVPVLRAYAAEGQAGLPFGPFLSVLEPFVAGMDWTAMPAWVPGALSVLFPFLRTSDRPALSELPPDQAQARLLSAVAEWVHARLPRNAVLFVDDLPRLDAASRALVLRLADEVSVVATARSEELPLDHPFRLALYQRERRAAMHCLANLTQEAVEALVSRLAGSGQAGLADYLLERTRGNPLFVVSVLQQLFEEGTLYVDADGLWAQTCALRMQAPPPRIQELLEARLNRLSPTTRRVFDLVALLGRGFAFRTLQHASGMEEQSLLHAVDQLLSVGLLAEPRQTGRPEYLPPHEMYLEVARETLPDARRRLYHRHLANALVNTLADPDVEAAVIAYHFERGHKAGEAYPWFVKAARVAADRHAHAEALAFYERALALGVGEAAPLWMAMGHIYFHLAQYKDAVSDYERALAQYAALRDGTEVTAPEVLSVAEKADLSDAVHKQAEAHYALAEAHRECSEFEAAVQHAQRGLDLAEALAGAPALVARGHIVLSNAMRSGQLAPVATFRQHLERARELAEDAGAWELIGQATFWLGAIEIRYGKAVQAMAYDRQALEQFRRAALGSWEAITLNNLATHAQRAGALDVARHAAEDGLALARRIDARNTQGWLLSTLGEIQLHLGELARARETLAKGLALVRQAGPRRLEPGLLVDLARVDLAEGHADTGLARLTTALTLARDVAPQFVPQLRLVLAEACLAARDPGAARKHAACAQTAAQVKGQRQVEAQAWRVLGQIDARSGHGARAEAAFAKSVEILAALDDELELARTYAAWGMWLAEGGDARADILLSRSGQTFQRMQARLDLRQL